MAGLGDGSAVPVAAQLAAQQDKVDEFLREVGQEALAKSVVAQGRLRDVWILRFLIGFKWKPKECAEKFKNMLNYRVQHGCDAIRAGIEAGNITPPTFPGYKQHHDAYVCTLELCSGRAKSGAPIVIECTPKFDFETLFAMDVQTQDGYAIHCFEYNVYLLDKMYLETGYLCGLVKIFDLDKIQMKQISVVNQWRQASALRQTRLGVNVLECYPECYAKVLVVNTPTFFSVFWKIIKPFLPARTAEKVKVESNPKKAKEKMLELIDAKVLPSFLGGDYSGDWIMR